jgi:transcriptional regulator with XRE-family HTH domain
MARIATGLGIRELAELAKVSPNTVARLERGEKIRGATVTAIQGALEAAGIQFIPENGGGAGVRLKFSRDEVKAIDALENEGGIVGEDDV